MGNNVTDKVKALSLPSELASVDAAAAEGESFAKGAGFGEAELFAIDLAVREAVANAVKHGNKLDPAKKVEVTFSDSDRGLEVTVRDQGTGFDISEVPDPTNPENLLKANGRGILFMKNFMEVVEWDKHPEGGTIVKMCKLR